MNNMTKAEAILLIEETYDEFKEHTLGCLTRHDLAMVDSLMSELVSLLTED